MPDAPQEEWVRERRERVTAQAERLARQQAEETAQAVALIAGFVAAARAAGLAPTELRALSPSGASFRTGVRGWLLRRDGRSAVGEDAAFYLLSVPLSPMASLVARWRGVTLTASEPPLIMGRGGRDGDSLALADALDRCLAEPGVAS